MKAAIKKILDFKKLDPIYVFLRDWRNRIRHHLATLKFVCKVVVPLIIHTHRRPVLFFRYVGMGDIISTFPAAHQLKKRHQGSAFIYSCLSEFISLPKMGEITDIVTPLRADVLGTTWSFLFAAVYNFKAMEETPLSSTAELLIAGFCRQYNLSIETDHPKISIGSDVILRVKTFLKKSGVGDGPIIVIHPGPSWPVREWPRESWIDLVQKFAAKGFGNIVQLGVNFHSCLDEVSEVDIPNVLSFVDRLTLEESIALLSLCKLFIGIDSGLLHIAASLRTPGVGIFGPTSPAFRFSPASSCSFIVSNVECQGCHHRLPRLHWITGCPYDIRCMKEISVDKVLELCLNKLSRPSAQL